MPPDRNKTGKTAVLAGLHRAKTTPDEKDAAWFIAVLCAMGAVLFAGFALIIYGLLT